jgi:hypothetical protein
VPWRYRLDSRIDGLAAAFLALSPPVGIGSFCDAACAIQRE